MRCNTVQQHTLCIPETTSKVVGVSMDVNGIHSPGLAVIGSSKLRRVSLSEDKSVTERSVGGVEDDGGRLVLCRWSAVTHNPPFMSDLRCAATRVFSQASSWHSTAVPQPWACPEPVIWLVHCLQRSK